MRVTLFRNYKSVGNQFYRKFRSSCPGLYNKFNFCKEDGGEEPHICTPYNSNESSTLNIDYSKSRGNILVDDKGNRLVDLYLQNGSLPLGYNHGNLVSALKSMEGMNTVVHIGPHSLQPKRYFELLDTTLLAVAPQGLSCVHISAGMSNPITQAITVAAERYWKLCCANWDSSCQGLNEDRHSRSRSFSVLTFEGSQFADAANPFNTANIPYPNIKHPFHENISYNRREEGRCLEQCFETIRTCASNQKHAMAIVVDPSHIGKASPSPEFYNYIRAICKELNVAFIVNEIDTCMNASSSFWSHAEWNLTNTPDIVVFGKKMVASGFYFDCEFHGFQPPAIMKGVAEDQTNLVLLEEVLKTISDEGLFVRVHETSLSIKKHMNALENMYPRIIENVHTRGCFCDVTFVDSSMSYAAETILRNAGVHFGRGNEKTLMMRPSLVLSPNHIHFVNKVVEETLQKLEKRTSLQNRSV